MQESKQRQLDRDPRQQKSSVRIIGIVAGMLAIGGTIATGLMGWNPLAEKTDNTLAKALYKTDNTLYPIRQGKNLGYIDRMGKIVIPAKFPPGNNTFHSNMNFGFDTKEEAYAPEKFKFSEGLASIKVKDKWGYIDRNGTIKISPQFTEVNNFKNGLAKVKFDDLQRGFIDTSGKVIGKFSDVGSLADFNEGLAAVRIDGTWGYIDKSGKLVISPQFSNADEFHHGFALVEFKDGYKGFIDKNGKIIFKDKFFYSHNGFREGFAWIVFNPANDVFYSIFIDKTGKILANRKFQMVNDFNEGLAGVKIDDKWGFIDETGKTIFKPQFQEVGDFNEGLAAVKIDGKWGFIDKTGSIVIRPQFEDVKQSVTFNSRKERDNGFKDGLARVKIRDKWGYIDKTGKLIIAPQFNLAYEFEDGLASVLVNDKWGEIDKNGKEIVRPQFSERLYFRNGIASAKVENIINLLSGDVVRYGYIDKTGKYVWNPS